MRSICLSLLITCLLFADLFAQSETNCSCAEDFAFVRTYLETNLPGFADNVTEETRADYNRMTAAVGAAAAKAKDPIGCLKQLNRYVEFFRDNHTSIYDQAPNVDESDEEQLRKFLAGDRFLHREKLAVDTAYFTKKKKRDPVEGIYETTDGAYRVALVKNVTPERDYAAVILASKTRLWQAGQVKFELKRKGDGFEGYFYYRNHSLRYEPHLVYRDGKLGDSWIKVNATDKSVPKPGPGNEFEFRELDEQTTYLRLPTFGGEYYSYLDSFYQAVFPKIEAKPYLIIDVRNNGGGSDANVSPLLPLLYTQPIINDEVVEIYATADNASAYERYLERMRADSARYSASTINWFTQMIERMKAAAPGTFIPMSDTEVDTVTLDSVPDLPKKVALLYNRGCASSCETLVFLAQRSDKTILMGENSGGYVGYGNVFSVTTPCHGFGLQVTTTRYRNQRKYEVIGVAPDVRLNNNEDWIEAAKNKLKEK